MAKKRATSFSDEEIIQIRARIKQYSQLINLSVGKMGLYLGTHEQYLKSFTGNPNIELRRNFDKAFPALNYNWVITGKGNMIKEGWEGREKECYPQPTIVKKNNPGIVPVSSNDSAIEELIATLKEQLEKKDRMIEMLWEKLNKATEVCK